ncbi:DUF6318 family protein [Nesterenkonia jeotgali]|uniref:DUF6318 family protein n=1 Tax=Nesterenkonia jeotgali TaxID=317018 RepID=UPI000ACAF241|nr:DUF6318 family protein [Nesterenkonia jeotgali]
MNTSAGRLGAVGLAVILSCALSSCGDEDAGDEPGGTGSEPSPVESSPAAGATDASGPSGNAGEEPSPESSPTPVPASSEGPAQNWPEPEVPDEIYEETQEGALAALEYWFEAITYLQLTGDSGPVESTTGSGCDVCFSRIDRYLDLYEREEGWYRAEGTVAKDGISTTLGEGAGVAVLFTIEDGEFEPYDSSGNSLGVTSARTYSNAEATLRFGDGAWSVEELVVRESDS